MADASFADTKRRLLSGLSRLAKVRKPNDPTGTTDPAPLSTHPVPTLPQPAVPSAIPPSVATTPRPFSREPLFRTPVPQPARVTAGSSTAQAPPSTRQGQVNRGLYGDDASRRLPGPAGLVVTPGSTTPAPMLATEVPVRADEPPDPFDMLPVKDVDFDRPAWHEMLHELGISTYRPSALETLYPHPSPYLRENIYGILRVKPTRKLSFLLVMVREIKWAHMDAWVAVIDPSGEMQGTIHRRVMEQHPNEIATGTCLVLRDVSLFRSSAHSLHLNITPRNVAYVFWEMPRTVHDVTTHQSVTETELHKWVDPDFAPPSPGSRPGSPYVAEAPPQERTVSRRLFGTGPSEAAPTPPRLRESPVAGLNPSVANDPPPPLLSQSIADVDDELGFLLDDLDDF
ncbi:hypothetical protein IWQ60_008730 [Tieghemiomyces parasiticus]|uniref:Homologous recombination OB-fold protein OB-fold domain-containing protein n=1 Tax=Tieghemiomyces parasiticus TaxID=78921 RepID=A0A9W7ZRN2_9FUNG|nr:hypothetical protein IWQ60_008730 [Tieghemiomyces parasiticus]